MSERMRGHARGLGQWATDDINIQVQLMQQFYDQPMQVAVTMPDSTVKSIQIEVQKLPKARVRILVSPEDTVKDKLQGQNAMQMAQSGLLDSPYADLFLGKLGFSPTEIKEFQNRKALQEELVPPGTGPNLSLVSGGPDAQLQPQ
jgi:hypothetical protein